MLEAQPQNQLTAATLSAENPASIIHSKYQPVLLIAFILSLLALSLSANVVRADSAMSGAKVLTDLQMPESVIVHADGRVFISEIGGFGKNGDGRISVHYPDGSRKILAEGLNDPKGIDLFNNQLYVADIDHLLRFDLDGKKTILAKPADFQDKPIFLNDVEIDGLGNVYVSDSGDENGKHAAVYKRSVAGEMIQIINASAGIKRPNGLLMDGPNRLLVADFATGDLFALAFDGTSSTPQSEVTLLNRGFGGADGLVRDAQGFLYISDWSHAKVWQLSEPKATPQLISSGHQSAADISLSADGAFLLIPDMKAGKLIPIAIR